MQQVAAALPLLANAQPTPNQQVSDITKPNQKIVLLEHNQTIGDALKTLAKAQILSAPMVGACGGAGAGWLHGSLALANPCLL